MSAYYSAHVVYMKHTVNWFFGSFKNLLTPGGILPHSQKDWQKKNSLNEKKNNNNEEIGEVTLNSYCL